MDLARGAAALRARAESYTPLQEVTGQDGRNLNPSYLVQQVVIEKSLLRGHHQELSDGFRASQSEHAFVENLFQGTIAPLFHRGGVAVGEITKLTYFRHPAYGGHASPGDGWSKEAIARRRI